jgi:hypothetical protein
VENEQPHFRELVPVSFAPWLYNHPSSVVLKPPCSDGDDNCNCDLLCVKGDLCLLFCSRSLYSLKCKGGIQRIDTSMDDEGCFLQNCTTLNTPKTLKAPGNYTYREGK